MLGTGGAMLAIAGCIVMDCIVIVGGARDVALASPAAVKPPAALKAPAAAASPPAAFSKDVPLSPEAAMASEPGPPGVAYGLNK